MNRGRIIEVLLQHDLKKYRFSVWARFNDSDILEYSLSLKGEKPIGYDIHLVDIGGISDGIYTYGLIDDMLIYALDYKLLEYYYNTK